MRTGQRARVSRMIASKVSRDQVGEPSSLRAWMCTTAAPASYARRASSAISTGVYGIAGQCFLVVTAPVKAHDRITLSAEEELIRGGSRPARGVSRREREGGDFRQIFDHAAARRRGD